MTKFASLFTGSGIILHIDGENFTVPNDHPNLAKIKQAIADHQYDTIINLIDVRSAVRNWLSNDKDFALENDVLVLHGSPFSPAVTDKVLNMIDAGANAEPLFKFLRKLRENPSATAQAELLLFCVANNFMIHEDGDVLAYKAVRQDYKDIYSGKIDNSVGQIVTVERGLVDDNRDRTCSFGLHFAAHEYAEGYGGLNSHMMVMKIHPRDVVSIPSDYHNQKGRCCRYEVYAELGDHKPLPKKEVYTAEDCGVASRAEQINDEIARVEGEINRINADLESLEDTISQIEDLGGDPSQEQLDDVNDLENKLDNLNAELSDLSAEYESLQTDSQIPWAPDNDDADDCCSDCGCTLEDDGSCPCGCC